MTRATGPTSIVLLLALSLVRTLSSQEPHLAPGDHIRLHQTNPCCAPTVTGILLSATPDSVSYRPPEIAEVFTLPRGSIVGVDRRVAAGDRKREGAAIGLLAGAVIGGMLGSRGTHAQIDKHSWKGFDTAVGGFGGALAGVLVGVIVGGRLSWEHWEAGTLPTSVSPSSR